MKQTTQFGLNQWEQTDRIMMEDFNRDNAKVDAALADHTADARRHLCPLACQHQHKRQQYHCPLVREYGDMVQHPDLLRLHADEQQIPLPCPGLLPGGCGVKRKKGPAPERGRAFLVHLNTECVSIEAVNQVGSTAVRVMATPELVTSPAARVTVTVPVV